MATPVPFKLTVWVAGLALDVGKRTEEDPHEKPSGREFEVRG